MELIEWQRNQEQEQINIELHKKHMVSKNRRNERKMELQNVKAEEEDKQAAADEVKRIMKRPQIM